MNQTTFQPAEIYDSNGSIIQQGAYGINTPFASSTGDGVYDYIVNNLNALKDMIAAGYIAVATLPASGQTNKYYVITEGANAGKCYIWTGTAWRELATQINGKSAYEIAVDHGFVGTEQQWLDSFTADAIAAANRAEVAMETIETGLETLEGIDARFGNIEDHAKITDSNVDATKKRISNIEKLLQGNLYDYQTDSTEAYTKTVPSGALPYAGVEKIGGKTLVMNQLCNTAGWNKSGSGITITAQDGVVSMTGTATASASNNLQNINVVKDHKYLLYTSGVDYPISTNASAFMQIYGADTILIQIPESSTTGYVIGSATGSGSAYIRIRQQAEETYDLTFIPKLIDLTLMFGAGNEPSTVEEFKAMFPASYYPYNAGTLLSAGVTEVESMGKNLVDQDVIFGAVSGATQTSEGWQCDASSLYVKYKNDYSTNLFPAIYSQSASVSFDVKLASADTGKALYVGFVDNENTKSAETISLTTNWQHVTKTQTTTANARKIYFSYNSNTTVIIKNFQVEVGETSTTYVPYMEATMPIPAEVQALTGYGLGTEMANYIDFERKVFIQNLGVIVLDGVTTGCKMRGQWSADHPYVYYTSGWANIGKRVGNYKKFISDRFVATSSNQSTMEPMTFVGGSGAEGTISFAFPTTVTTLEDANTWLSNNPTTVYYPLATPIETDVSAYLTDNLIEVGAGGTLTMYSDANGDDDAYHIPVPSTVEYMIDLNVATGGTENEP